MCGKTVALSFEPIPQPGYIYGCCYDLFRRFHVIKGIGLGKSGIIYYF